MSDIDPGAAYWVDQVMLGKVDRLMALRNWCAAAYVDTNDEHLDEFFRDIKPVLDALHDLACCDRDMWHMNATAFTCTEADAIAGLLRALDGDEGADVFLGAHAEGDDFGDSHMRIDEPPGWAHNPENYPGDDEPRLTGHPPNPETEDEPDD